MLLNLVLDKFDKRLPVAVGLLGQHCAPVGQHIRHLVPMSASVAVDMLELDLATESIISLQQHGQVAD